MPIFPNALKRLGDLLRRPLLPSAPGLTPTTVTSTVTERSLTFNLAAAVPVGAYAADGFFAVGGQLVSTTPPSAQQDGTYAGGESFTGRWVHGLMLNPGTDGGNGLNPPTTPQGFDSLAKAPSVTSVTELAYDHGKNVDPGATGAAVTGNGKSLVKSKSILVSPDADSRNKLADVAILTLVDTVPPAGSFRRWAGAASKAPLFTTTDIDWTALPSLAQPAGSTLRSADTLVALLGPFQTYFNQMLFTRGVNPSAVQRAYGGDIAMDVTEAILFTMTAGVSTADRNRVALKLIQAGLDLYDALEAGRRWGSTTLSFGGAHQWVKVLVVYAATLLRNAANVAEAAKLAAWVNAVNRPVFGEDLMTLTVTRNHIEATPYESINTRLFPTGFWHPHENMVDWLSKPSTLDSVTFSYDVAYRTINLYPFLCTALIARLLGQETAWAGPRFFTYCDRLFRMWELRGSPANSYLSAYGRAMLLVYYRTQSPAYTGTAAPTVSRRVGRDGFVWAEASEPLDPGYQPAAGDLAVTVDGAAVTLATASTTATGVASSGSTNVSTPVISVASASGIRVGMRVASANLPPDTFVTSVSGTTIGISSLVPTAFSAQPVAFHPVYIFGRALVAVLPTALASAAQAVTLGYTPGATSVRNLRGVNLAGFAATACANKTGELPAGATTKAMAYSGATAATRQFAGTATPKAASFTRLLLSIRFELKSALQANDTVIASATGSTNSLRLYGVGTTAATDLRLFLHSSAGGKQLRLPAALTGVPLDTPLTLHVMVDASQTVLTSAYKAALVWAGGGNTNLSVTGSTAFAGTETMSLANFLTGGLFLFANGATGATPFHGGIAELAMLWGDNSLALPADLAGTSYAAAADWGGNGQLVYGQQPQLYYAGSIDEWNAGLLNRGNFGGLGMSLRRFNDASDPDSGLATPFAAYA